MRLVVFACLLSSLLFVGEAVRCNSKTMSLHNTASDHRRMLQQQTQDPLDAIQNFIA